MVVATYRHVLFDHNRNARIRQHHVLERAREAGLQKTILVLDSCLSNPELLRGMTDKHLVVLFLAREACQHKRWQTKRHYRSMSFVI